MKDNSYNAVMSRKNDIMKAALGIDYSIYESGSIAFDYERMMKETAYSLDEMKTIQAATHVGNTPLIEAHNLTALARKCAEKNGQKGMGARIFIKDEACNPAGSFKARRAAIACYQAKKMGYKGVIAATSGNYGAAVASQAAMLGLQCIILQECYDSRGVGQPEIIEKARKCEAFGAEVVQMTVGPELFYKHLLLLEETGFFNCSLYTPFGIAGIETLGAEIHEQFMQSEGRDPDVVICTEAGGGNLTGTARGLRVAGAKSHVYGASVNLSGLSMASDVQFNKKSFTTGHTGFGVPYATNPDHSDVPRSGARPLRYMERYLIVAQGSVFYITEALSTLEGIERGPAGNTSLTAAFAFAQTLPQDAIIVSQETEYTGAGKHHQPQISFARENGIDVHFGNPADEVPGTNMVLPAAPELIKATDMDMERLHTSLIKHTLKSHPGVKPTEEDIAFLAEETMSDKDFVRKVISQTT
ncbi:MAG: PLP-dependent lyase/thiolase [Spirochaetaceae bacterium]|nr:PLP-dependent lyase/thiolase [Spirochaetaceae bacterium]